MDDPGPCGQCKAGTTAWLPSMAAEVPYENGLVNAIGAGAWVFWTSENFRSSSKSIRTTVEVYFVSPVYTVARSHAHEVRRFRTLSAFGCMDSC